MRRHVWIGFCCALSLFGSGCFKGTVSAPPTATSTVSATQPQKFPTFVAQPPVTTPATEIAKVIEDFSLTKSFRAKVHTVSGKTEIIGAMEFAKPNRFRGLIQSGKDTQTEIIIVDNDLFMRTTGEEWKDYSSTRGSQTLGEAMRAALSGDDAIQQLVLGKSKIEKSEDPVRACTQYVVSIDDKTGTRTVRICVADGLPKFVDTFKSDGSTSSIEYFDYNAVFTIAKPM